MNAKDFTDYGIEKVTAADITGTGAALDSVNLFLILKVDEFAKRCPYPVVLLPNGLTTGIHRSTWHPRGLAVDLAFDVDPATVKIYDLWKLAIECGFTGVGVYWNGTAYSMHLDLRPHVAFWSGRKAQRGRWNYGGVFQDPAKLAA